MKEKIKNSELSDQDLIDYFSRSESNKKREIAGYGQLLHGFYLTLNNDEEAKLYYQKVIAIANKSADTLLLIDAYNELAYHLRSVSVKRDSSILLFEQAFQLANSCNYSQGIIQSSYGLAFNLMDQGNFLKAMEYMLDLRPFIDLLNDPIQTARLLNNIGHIYMQLELNEEAIDLFKEFNEVVKDEESAQVYRLMGKTNLAEAYIKNNQIDKAANALDEVLELSKDGFPLPQEAFYYRILGKISLRKNEFAQALNQFELAINQKDNRQIDRIIALLGESEAYLGLGDTIKSHQVLLRAEEICQKIDLFPLSEKVGLNKALSNSYDYLGYPEKALEYTRLHFKAYQELHNERIVSDFFLKEIGERLERQRRQADLEKELYDQTLKSERQQNLILLVTTVLVVISLILAILRYLDKSNHAKNLAKINDQIRKQKTSIEEQAGILKLTNDKISFLNKDLEKQVEKTVSELSEKDRIINKYSYMNSHQLRSPVASIIGLSTLIEDASEYEKKEVIDLILLEAKRLDEIVREIQQSLDQKLN